MLPARRGSATRQHDAHLERLPIDCRSQDGCELRGEGNGAFLLALRLLHLVLGERPHDADDSRGEVDVADPEAPDLPAPEPGIDAEGERDPEPIGCPCDEVLAFGKGGRARARGLQARDHLG
jgi:hypothetical protein